MNFVKDNVIGGGVSITLNKDDVLRILESNNYQLIENFQYKIEADESYLSDLEYIGERFHRDIADMSFFVESEETNEMLSFIREALIDSDLVFSNVVTDEETYSIENYGVKKLIFELVSRIDNQQVTFDDNEELAKKYEIHYSRLFSIYKGLQ